jgi:tRNA A37 threonylcarbamoyladenosine biosynthesis protein TsaE
VYFTKLEPLDKNNARDGTHLVDADGEAVNIIVTKTNSPTGGIANTYTAADGSTAHAIVYRLEASGPRIEAIK